MAFGVNPATGRPGPAPKPARNDDRKQARQRINAEVRTGSRAHPNALPCVDCGHVWVDGERRHEYDHYLGYSPGHHQDVEPVCTTCHAVRTFASGCRRGHPCTVESVLVRADGRRTCRVCRRERERKRRDAAYWRVIRANRRVA